MTFNQSWINIASQFGMPLFGVTGLPAFTGNYFWVDQTNGSDGNTGGPQDPFKTLSQAHSVCKADNNDVVLFMGTITLTSTLVWSKNKTHLVGLGAVSQNNRARISGSGTVFTPMVSVTSQGCIFKDFGTFYGFNSATAQVCWIDTGGRNRYEGVLFQGGGHATAAAQAGMRSLVVSGLEGENRFVGCTIGLDTVTRATNANASLELTGGSPRNVFKDCIFPALVSAAGDVHVLIGAAGIDRWALFDNCVFNNAIDSTATPMTAAMSVNAAAGGSVLLNNCLSVGADAIATAGPVYVNQIGTAGGATTYQGVAAS